MTLIIAAGLCSLFPPVYFIRLMADAQKLQRRVLERRSEFHENAQEKERLLIEFDQVILPDPDRLSSGQN